MARREIVRLAKGQVFECKRSDHGYTRTIEVISPVEDDRGRVDVWSINKSLKTRRRILVQSARLQRSDYRLIHGLKSGEAE